MTITINPLPLSWFIDRLQRGEPFAYARFGDGEWAAILGRPGRTRDGQRYTPGLRAELTRALISPWPYTHGLGPMATRLYGSAIEAWMARNCAVVDWYDTETLLNASLAGELLPFVNALQARHILLIGPPHLRHLTRWLPNVIHRESAPQDVYGMVDELEAWALWRARPSDVLLLSCGPAAKCLVNRLWKALPECTLIDTGSVWDPYCGVRSRSYMRRAGVDWKALAEKNLGAPVRELA